MGAYLVAPKTEKTSETGGSLAEHSSRYAITAMQGWRMTMEDAHLAIPCTEERKLGLYGVFDGHGGAAVSAWVAKHFNRVFEEEVTKHSLRLKSEEPTEASKDFPPEVALICEALQHTFFELDVRMQTDDSRSELKELHESLKGDPDAPCLLHEILKNAVSGPTPLVRIVERNGQKFYQILAAEDHDEESKGVAEEGRREILVSDGVSGAQRVNRSGCGAPESARIEDVDDMETEYMVGGNKEEDGEKDRKVEDSGHESSESTKSDVTEQLSPEGSAGREEGEGGESIEMEYRRLNSTRKSKSVDEEERACARLANARGDEGEGVKKSRTSGSDSDLSDAECSVHAADLSNEIAIDSDTVDDGEDQELPGDPSAPEYCGATAVVAVVMGGETPALIIANAGDSRAVLCRGGEAIPLSHDHKPHLPSEMDRIYSAGGTVTNGRVDGNLNLSRSVGDLFYKNNSAIPPEAQRITVLPDIRVCYLTEEDEFAILACDGIWDCMSNKEAVDFVRGKLQEVPDRQDPHLLTRICEEMCDKCLSFNPVESEGIGCDNMTCMVVELSKCFKGGQESYPPVLLYGGGIDILFDGSMDDDSGCRNEDSSDVEMGGETEMGAGEKSDEESRIIPEAPE